MPIFEKVQNPKHLLLRCRLYQDERKEVGITRETTLHFLQFTMHYSDNHAKVEWGEAYFDVWILRLRGRMLDGVSKGIIYIKKPLLAASRQHQDNIIRSHTQSHTNLPKVGVAFRFRFGAPSFQTSFSPYIVFSRHF